MRTHSVEPSLFSMQAGCVAVSKRHAEQRRRVHTPGTGMQHMPLHMLMNGIPSSLTHPGEQNQGGRAGTKIPPQLQTAQKLHEQEHA